MLKKEILGKEKGYHGRLRRPGELEAAYDPSRSAPGLTWKLDHDDDNYEK